MSIEEIASIGESGEKHQFKQELKRLRLVRPDISFSKVLASTKLPQEEKNKVFIRPDGVISLEGTSIGNISEQTGYARKPEQNYNRYG